MALSSNLLNKLKEKSGWNTWEDWHPRSQAIVKLFPLILILIAIPLTVEFLQQQQNLTQEAYHKCRGSNLYCLNNPTNTPTPIAYNSPTFTPTPTLTGTINNNTQTPSGLTFDEECSGPLNSEWSSLYGTGDPGDRLDTDMMGNLSQVSVANGICTINVQRMTTPSGRPFAGATMATFGTFGQKYGTWETRARYDEAAGTWPSWFLLPVGQKGPYPEIDAFEAYGDPACLGPGYLEQVVHHAGEIVSDYKIVPVTNSSGWHTHKLVWTANKVEFWLDGVLTFSTTANVPQVAMYPIFTYGVGAPNSSCRASSATPATLKMDIDYIRVSP